MVEAHERGIETWVSLEPVIYPEQSKKFVRLLYKVVSHFKIGAMNYHPHGKTIDWHKFGWEIKGLCDSLEVKYYLKKDLLKEMGVNPADFKQTWVYATKLFQEHPSLLQSVVC